MAVFLGQRLIAVLADLGEVDDGEIVRLELVLALECGRREGS